MMFMYTMSSVVNMRQVPLSQYLIKEYHLLMASVIFLLGGIKILDEPMINQDLEMLYVSLDQSGRGGDTR